MATSVRSTHRRLPLRPGAVAALWLTAITALAQAPYGLDSRSPIGPYLNGIMPPQEGAFAFPSVLSATGAFTDLQALSPSQGLVAFTVNSPLWSDGAVKTRWMAVPNDGPPYGPDEQIGFAPIGEWTFPDGTVFVKNFELVVDEGTGARKRQETRFLVRKSGGGVYGVTYKWRADNSDADLLADGLEEDVAITAANGATRIQRYSYPSRGDCLFCHNQPANYVLGPKTHQLNGDFTYLATGRTDNQLRTLNHLGLLNPAPSETTFATYLKSVTITSTTAPVQDRMRSWIDSNCSQCHRPNGFCPSYDARFYTPLGKQNLINTFVKFRDLAGSELYQRDNSLGQIKMPPLAKNVVHEVAMANLRQWIASPLEVLSVYLHEDASHLAVRFNSRVDPVTGAAKRNYRLDQNIAVTEASISDDPDTVILTVSPLVQNQNYSLTVSDVRDTAPSANTIWPKSRKSFAADFAVEPTPPRLANISSRVQVNDGDRVSIGGFIARGGKTKRVMLRALGPSLSSSGVAGVLGDPAIELFDQSGTPIAMNHDWEENTNRQEIIDTGLAPPAPNESVILTTLPSSSSGVAYTAVLRGMEGQPGVGLLEVYDLDRTVDAKLANIATRGFVQTGDDVLIGGFIVAGLDSQKVIIRSLGPSLPVEGALPDPTLELHDQNGGLLRSNDNWRSDQQAAIQATGIPPRDDLECAIVDTLAPAAYTAIVRDATSKSGVAVLEIYALN